MIVARALRGAAIVPAADVAMRDFERVDRRGAIGQCDEELRAQVAFVGGKIVDAKGAFSATAEQNRSPRARSVAFIIKSNSRERWNVVLAVVRVAAP